MTSSTAIVLSSGRVTPQMKMAAGPRNGPDPFFHLKSEYLISYDSIEVHFGRILDQIR